MFTNQRKIQSVLFLGLALLISGCGGTAASGPTFDGKEYVVVDAGDLVFAASSVTGSGSFVFNAPLAEVGSKTSFRVSFTLEDTGSLSLVSNGTVTLTEGVALKVTRAGTALNVLLTAAGTTTDVSAKFAGVDASAAQVFQVDIHNDETPAHILVWDSGVTSFADSNARLNSEDTGFEAPGKGSSTYWGVTLVKAAITGATLSTAKFVE